MDNLAPTQYIHIYTDGGCNPNPGPGGYGVYITSNLFSDEEIIGDSNGDTTTNNRMELSAFIAGAKKAAELLPMYTNGGVDVQIFSDSNYVVKGITEWIYNWVKKPGGLGNVINGDLWSEALGIYNAIKGSVKVTWVKGHHKSPGNIKADSLATLGVERSKNVSRD